LQLPGLQMDIAHHRCWCIILKPRLGFVLLGRSSLVTMLIFWTSKLFEPSQRTRQLEKAVSGHSEATLSIPTWSALRHLRVAIIDGSGGTTVCLSDNRTYHVSEPSFSLSFSYSSLRMSSSVLTDTFVDDFLYPALRFSTDVAARLRRLCGRQQRYISWTKLSDMRSSRKMTMALFLR
jgi:hypothetical protein